MAMDFVKYFDFFGIKFHFYTNNQPNYQNIFGGIMNLIYIIICGILFFFISYDDLKMLLQYLIYQIKKQE